ncbi:MAG: HAD hydrolase family protein [Muribaculaceae bacterium]|nr:HAD hydrolase family protein [Muribaculaceae bacterium]
MRTLYVSDMDGTLLDNNSLVSPGTAAIISDLSRHGALITVATARTPATVEPLLAHTYTRCPAIVMTGAAMWDRDSRQLINEQLPTPGVAHDICREFDEAGIDPFIYTVANRSHLDVYHGCTMSPGEDDFYQSRRHLELKKFHIGARPADGEWDRTILIFSIGDTDRIKALADRLTARGDCSVSCYPDLLSPRRSLLEVFAPGVSKANAVRRLAGLTGADRVVVFGDNLNDLSMMEVADLAVAVDNAFPEVKEAADTVIGPNSANAVAHFIANEENRRP